MADNYGVTFAQRLIQRGEYEEAVAAADKHAAQDPESPEPAHDRARALSLLGRFAESVAAYELALQLDRSEQMLPDWEVDDGLFSTVVAWGQSLGGESERLAALERYKALLPQGRHLQEASDWALRFRGLLPTTFVKPRD
jgi:tetratricopeptide (TPR) repeat protein